MNFDAPISTKLALAAFLGPVDEPRVGVAKAWVLAILRLSDGYVDPVRGIQSQMYSVASYPSGIRHRRNEYERVRLGVLS